MIDDDPSVRKALERLIRSAKMEVRTFASAEEFLDSHVALPDCMIVDIYMPGMSGLDLQQRLHADHFEVPLVFISAHDDERIREDVMAAGAIGFLHKPFEDNALLDFIARAVA